MKGIIILADYFEDTEAITTIDIIRRAKIKLDVIGLEKKIVKTQNGLTIECDNILDNVDYKDYDFLVIPGGKAVFKTLVNEKKIEEIILYFNSKEKLIATICAAPNLVGRLGLFKDLNYTCFPGCAEGVIGNNTNCAVEVSKHFITGKAMGYTVQFALEIVKYLEGLISSNEVNKSIHGE